MLSELEERAKAATELDAFPVNIVEIRTKTSALLSEIGRYGFFDEYTTHSFTHVKEMISLLEWLIPSDTKERLTPAECFLLVTSVYFHDLGLLITKDEYDQRDSSGYKEYAEQTLFAGDAGEDYKARLGELSAQDRDRILYQEFVRSNHGARVRAWLEGKFHERHGASNKIVFEIESLIGKLAVPLRRDLATICESHTLDDIDDTEKYRLAQPYGNSREEEANLQYVAALLRTADLLQISKSRAPSTLFRIINPSDPVSQIEWQKQNAVTRIRGKPVLDEQGHLDTSSTSDTVEIHAHFTRAEGYFGLTSYIDYANRQIERSYRAIERSQKKAGVHYQFPWRRIDDNDVKAEGFIPKKFEFRLDQSRILTLLTGHTLYNDSTVVLRELMQNAIDAVRLQWEEKGLANEGRILVEWNSLTNELTITDNGTGMTQEIVEQHLLTVGSSRYQDKQFQEKHPSFSPISRFGIGILTAFMVADSVEILTCSAESEEDARQISLRNVHGKYLVRLIPRHDAAIACLEPHGTSIRIKVRKSAKALDVRSTLERWIVFPRCYVELRIDSGDPVAIGFASPKVALETYLESYSGKDVVGGREYRVIDQRRDGLDVAYAVAKDPFFKDWSLVSVVDRSQRSDGDAVPVGTCIEGIAVDFDSPGFAGPTIMAIANATGKSAPRTNVARSALEETDQRTSTLAELYSIYVKQIKDEVSRLAVEEEYSLSWAVSQAPYIASPLIAQRAPRLDSQAFDRAVAEIPIFLLESGKHRTAASLLDLERSGDLWVVASPLVGSVESLVREAPSNITVREIINLTHGPDWLPQGITISDPASSPLAIETLFRRFEVKEFVAHTHQRRIDVKLGLKAEAPLWLSDATVSRQLRRVDPLAYRRVYQALRERSNVRAGGVHVAGANVGAVGLDDYGAVDVLQSTYILPEEGISRLIFSLYAEGTSESLSRCSSLFSLWTRIRSRIPRNFKITQDYVARSVKQLESQIPDVSLDSVDVAEALFATSFRVFDPSAWARRESEGLEIDF